MTLFPGITRRLRALFSRTAVERDLDEEIRLHLDLEAEKLMRGGVSREEARRRARLAFGNIEVAKESYREGWGFLWLRDLWADTRYALRALRRNPVLASAAIVTLAVGIGANTAMFSAVNGVILKPLPFPAADRLVMLWESNPEFHWYQQTAAPANALDWRDQVSAFADVAMYDDGTSAQTLTGWGAPKLLHMNRVTGNFFSVLGVRAALGRTLRWDETWDTSSAVVVISHRLWREQFGADSGIVGRSIQLGGQAITVVGVMPRSFAFPSPEVDLWTPNLWVPAYRTQVWFRRAHWTRVVARLKPGVTLTTANAELQSVVRRLQREYPATNRVMGAGLTPLHDFLIRDTRQPLAILFVAVGLLLLIACANVGNLLLVRAADREREASLRLTLGAGRGRLIRQALTESAVLSALGGAAGVVVGWWGTRMLLALQPAGMLPATDVRIQWTVLAYVIAITTVSGLLFGVAPALWSSRRTPAEVLREGARGSGTGRRAHRWGNALVIGEVAIALLLTIGAGLLVRSLWSLEEVDPGFDPHGVLAVQLNLPGARYGNDARQIGFYDQLTERARALPGVTAAAATSEIPLTDFGWTSVFTVAGWPAGKYGTEVAHREVTPGYFTVMHVPILRGRDFTAADGPHAPPVVLINEALARRYFPGENPIGARVTFDKTPDSTSVWRTIVGVVGDEHQTELGIDTKVQFIAPYAQSARSRMYLILRTTGAPSALAPAVRRIVASLDPDLAIIDARTMDDVRAASLALQRFLMTMLLVFAGAGLLLALVGVYGVIAQLARRRTREMGIRVALGAQVGDVRWLVVRHGLGLVAVGLAIGLGAAFAVTRAMNALLYQVAPVDPLTFVAVPALLILTATLATWIPAVRVSRTDPATTLRAE